MLSVIALLSFCSLVYAALELHTASVLTYPFGTHLPLEPQLSPPPAIIFLHGSGSRAGNSSTGPEELASLMRSRLTYDGIGWLLSQYDGGNKTGAQQIVAEEYLTVLPLLPDTSDEWDPEGVMSVLTAMESLADANSTYAFDKSRVTLAGYSIGSFGTWHTAFYAGYPSPFNAILPFGASTGFSDSDLSILAHPPSNVSTLSIYAAGGSIDEKQPGEETVATIEQLEGEIDANDRNLERNWTSEIIFGATHKIMSQEAWFEMGVWNWLKDQEKGGRIDTVSTNATLTSSAAESEDQQSSAIRNRRIGWW